MCGIAGLIQFDGKPLDEGLLTSMTRRLAHRGPDGQGAMWFDEGAVRVGLGHARLKIIDLSDAAAQPMTTESQQVWVVFNGEIYNYRELRETLTARGARFRTQSDTEVILRLYEADGEPGLAALEGMFALAIWDRVGQVLLLLRDRMGKKPMFYTASPQRVAFASEVKALLADPECAAELDVDALPAFFRYGFVPSPGTFYRGIWKLPPGHLLRVERDGRARMAPYWDLPADAEVRPAPSPAEAAARVRELLTAAVRRRLLADVPLGAFLSGGLDSSIIVGLMSRLSEEPVRTFSIGFAGGRRYDETPYARLAAERFGTQHREFIVEPAAVELVERLVWHHDGPFADSSAIPTYLLAQLTREHVTVALSGDGGDEVFAGYLRFAAALWSQRLPRWAHEGARRLLCGLPAWGGPRGPWRRLQKFAGATAQTAQERLSEWAGVFGGDLEQLLPPERGGASVSLQAAALDVDPLLLQLGSPLSRLLYLNVKTYLLDDLLVKMDRCSMAHALEVRSPFLDRELVEYAWSLPDAMKLRGTRTKIILRRAFADLLPPAILRRGKMGFGVPLESWFRTELRAYVHDLLLAPEARLKRYVAQAYVRELCDAHFARRSDASNRLWALLTFEVWLRQLEQASVSAGQVPAVTRSGETGASTWRS